MQQAVTVRTVDGQQIWAGVVDSLPRVDETFRMLDGSQADFQVKEVCHLASNYPGGDSAPAVRAVELVVELKEFYTPKSHDIPSR